MQLRHASSLFVCAPAGYSRLGNLRPCGGKSNAYIVQRALIRASFMTHGTADYQTAPCAGAQSRTDLSHCSRRRSCIFPIHFSARRCTGLSDSPLPARAGKDIIRPAVGVVQDIQHCAPDVRIVCKRNLVADNLNAFLSDFLPVEIPETVVWHGWILFEQVLPLRGQRGERKIASM